MDAARTPNRQHIVGIAGGPGSGKSTIAQLVRDRINELAAANTSGDEVAVVVPMDGFHLYKHELDAMEDPKEAYARRGAHWTFDASAFLNCVRNVRQQGAAQVPSFDHAVGDPVPSDIEVHPRHRVVLVEGNYLLLDEPPWASLRELFDDIWFVECPLDVAMQRVFARQTGMGLAPEVSRGRIDGNDRPNGELVARTQRHAHVVVSSRIPFKRMEAPP